jgi:dTMP kinase
MNWDQLRGKFIVLDGPDGCGKSTQARLLAEMLEKNGMTAAVLRDPGGTRIGEQIRQILLQNDNREMSVRCEALLYMASRAQLFDQSIKPALTDGACVICDRWLSSTYAYQAVAGKIGVDWLLQLAQASLERTWPDLTMIIDVPSEIGLQRVGPAPDRMEEKSADFHQQVRQAFLHLAQTRRDVVSIDGSGTIDQVHRRIVEGIESEHVHF